MQTKKQNSDAIYLDYNSTAPLPVELLDSISSLYRSATGNPANLHSLGRQSRHLIFSATEKISSYLRTPPQSIYWTSGASEANSWILYSAIERAQRIKDRNTPPRILVSKIEHESVLMAARFWAEKGITVDYIETNPNGTISINHLQKLLNEGPADLVSVMFANNETGVLQPISEVSILCKTKGVPLHVDCVQAFGKYPIDLSTLTITYASFSGHKIGAPKGIGFLVLGNDFQDAKERLLYPLVHGKQQKMNRGGTENPFGVAVLGEIVGLLLADEQKESEHGKKRAEWHELFEKKLKTLVPEIEIHGSLAPRLGNTTYVSFPGYNTEAIFMSLDLEGICISAGSACSSGSAQASHVLLAMGCETEVAKSTLRFSSGRSTKWSDFERVLEVLPTLLKRAKNR